MRQPFIYRPAVHLAWLVASPGANENPLWLLIKALAFSTFAGNPVKNKCA